MNQKFKKNTLADNRAWDGFRGTAYYLDADKVSELPIQTQSGEQTTVGSVFRSLTEAEWFELEKSVLGLSITVNVSSGKTVYKGSTFNLEILTVLLTLHKKSMYPLSAAFFFYASDSGRNDPVDIYEFFIVCDKTIVEESLPLRDYPGSGFDPSVFMPEDDIPLRQAWVRLWYRRFYTETELGQLMALRPDAPALYYHPSRLGENSLELHALQMELQQIRWLLIVLIVGFVLIYLISR